MTTNNENMTLYDLKAGDTVVVYAQHFDPQLRKIARVTKTTIILEPIHKSAHQPAYRKSDGRIQRSDTWSFNYIKVPTTDEINKIKHDRLQKIVKTNLQSVAKYDDLTYEECTSLYEQLKVIMDRRT